MLFNVSQEISKVNTNYIFSLKWFMKIFEHELKSKEGINGAIDPLVDFN